GLALSRHIGDAPTLINALVGMAVAHVMARHVEDFIQTPGAPNLYWALTTLPRPFISLRKSLGGEQLILEAELPEVKDIETIRLSPGQQEALMKSLVRLLQATETGTAEASPEEVRLKVLGLGLKAYPEAKRALIAGGRKPAEVEAMPALQVTVIHWLRQYRRLQDDQYKWMFVPFWEAEPGLRRAEQEFKAAKRRLEGAPFSLLLPALKKVHFAQVRTDRRFAALRCV